MKRNVISALSVLLFMMVIGKGSTGIVHAQPVMYKIPVTLIDSFYNVSDNSFKKIKVSTLTFGVQPGGTRCVDFPMTFSGFQTHWTINDPDSVQESAYPGDPPSGERYVWDLAGCADGTMFYDNIHGYFASTQIDTFKVDIRFDNDASVYHHGTLVWPTVLAEYFDTCKMIKSFGLGSATTVADMRVASSFVIPPPADVSLFIRYTIYVHGIKNLPGYPATLGAIFPADGDTNISTTPALSWSVPAQGVFYYGLQVSTNPGFSTFVFNDTLSVNSKQLPALQGSTMYYWRGYAQNQYGASYFQNPPFQFKTGVVSDVRQVSPGVPERFALLQNYPNPFNPETHFEFRIVKFGLVSLKIFDITGREVATLVNEELQPGTYTVRFSGNNIASGEYIVRLRALPEGRSEPFVATRKIVLIK